MSNLSQPCPDTTSQPTHRLPRKICIFLNVLAQLPNSTSRLTQTCRHWICSPGALHNRQVLLCRNQRHHGHLTLLPPLTRQSALSAVAMRSECPVYVAAPAIPIAWLKVGITRHLARPTVAIATTFEIEVPAYSADPIPMQKKFSRGTCRSWRASSLSHGICRSCRAIHGRHGRHSHGICRSCIMVSHGICRSCITGRSARMSVAIATTFEVVIPACSADPITRQNGFTGPMVYGRHGCRGFYLQQRRLVVVCMRRPSNGWQNKRRSSQ